MKLCYLGSANSIHTQRWIKYFSEKGYDTHLISYELQNIENVKVYMLTDARNRYLSFFKRYFMVRKLIKKMKPDLVHAHYVGGYGWLGAFAKFHPFIVTAWGSDVLVEPKISIISRLLTRFALKNADLITCDGEHIKGPLIELGANIQKINLIRFGIDTQKFKPLGISEKIRGKLGIVGSFTVISLRNFEPIYDVESLITAIPSILKETPEAKFVIAGKGTQEVYLRQLVKSLGVSDSVRFVGFIPNNELPEWLSSVDVYVSTSQSDAGLAASTAEAMACGLPVVITDFGDNRKWVEDGINGFIIPLKDPKALAERIIYLFKRPDIRNEFGIKNREIIEERNNYYKEMEKMEKLYEALTERSGT